MYHIDITVFYLGCTLKHPSALLFFICTQTFSFKKFHTQTFLFSHDEYRLRRPSSTVVKHLVWLLILGIIFVILYKYVTENLSNIFTLWPFSHFTKLLPLKEGMMQCALLATSWQCCGAPNFLTYQVSWCIRQVAYKTTPKVFIKSWA